MPDSAILFANKAITENEKMGFAARYSAAAWNSIGYAEYMKGNYTSAATAFQQYYSFSKKSDDKINMAFALNNEGNIYIETGEYSKALEKYNEALEVRIEAKDVPGIAMSFNNIGFIHKDIGDYEKAITNFFFSLREYEKLKDKKAIAKTLNFIAIVYGKKKEPAKAISYLEKAIAIQKETGDYNELAISYQTLASVYTEQKQYEQSIASLNLALKIYEQNKDLRQIALVHDDFGNLFLQKKIADSASFHFSKAITINNQIGNKRNIAASWIGLAHATLILKKFPQTQAALDSAFAIINTTNKKGDLKQFYAIAAEYYAVTGDMKTAYHFQKKYTLLNDTLLNEQNIKSIADMEVKYETEKKEQEIKIQKAAIAKKNILLLSAVLLFILISLLSYSYYRRYQLKQKTKLQAEILKQQEIATKAVIEAEENERQRIARDLHDGIGQMMSAAKMNLSAFESDLQLKDPEQQQSFDKIIGLVDESCKELRSVSHNMMPNALLKNSLASAIRDFIDKMDKKALQVQLYTEGLDERLDANVETVLYRVIQECVNNVIKHAGADKLDISVIRDKDGISATIEDNGKGFDSNNKANFEGIGLKNIIARVEYLKGTVDFDSTTGKGTLVALHVPLLGFQ
jgi:signal transduction histidine kinase